MADTTDDNPAKSNQSRTVDFSRGGNQARTETFATGGICTGRNLPTSSLPPFVAATEPSPPGGRLERIDVLRAGAALCVVAYHHFGSFFGWYVPWRGDFRDVAGHLGRAVPLHLLSFGWMGVPLFFVLSGFCIHAGFLRVRKFNLAVFCWRRFWRIYPPYLVAVLVFSAWPINWLNTPFGTTTLLTNGLMVQNLSADTFWSKFNPSFWSVPTEFQCYLLYPVFLLLRRFWGTSRVVFGWFAFALVGKLITGAIEGWPEHPVDFGLCSPIFMFGDWALGALVAEKLINGERSRWLGSAAGAGLALALFFASALWRPSISVAFELASVCGAVLVFNYAARASRPNRLERVLSYVGVASYSLYLWHQPLLGPLTVLGRTIAGNLPLMAARIVTLLVIAAGLGVIAFCSYWLLERPSMAVAARKKPGAAGASQENRLSPAQTEPVRLRLQRPNPIRN